MQGKLCCKKRTSYDKHMKILQKRIMVHSAIHQKVKLKDIPVEVLNPITGRVEKTFIHSHTITNKDKSKPTVVFVHGFGGSTATYSDFVSYLTNDFSVISIDILGMGCSGKPAIEWIRLSASQIEDLNVSTFEQFRKAMKLTKVNFAGHSLGAYLICHYAKKYPENIGKIYAMSTPCFTHPPNEFDPKNLKLNFKRKMMYYFWNFMNRRYISGHWAFSSMPLKSLLTFWLKGRADYSEKKKEAIIEFTSAMFWDRGFSCDVITALMGYRGYAIQAPLADCMNELVTKGLKIKFVYGSKDWLDYEETSKCFKNAKGDVEFELVKDITHQMPLVAPQLMAEKVVDYFAND